MKTVLTIVIIGALVVLIGYEVYGIITKIKAKKAKERNKNANLNGDN